MKFYWEKQLEKNHIKYYEAKIQRDLFDDWVLICSWGRKNTKLGNSKCAAFGKHQKLLDEIAKVHKRRLNHGYKLINGDIAAINYSNTGCVENNKEYRHGNSKKKSS